jgi:hypothetical protein
MTRGKQASRAGILFSDVKPKRLEWDWYPFIPRGKVVIVDGEPEEGKSAFILDLMARITTGRSMPFAAELRGWSEVPSREPRGVVFLSAEDDLDDTLIPRAMAAGADRTRLIAEHFDDPLDLDQQGFARLRQLIARVKAVAVVLDPLVSYIPDRVNLYVDQASRRLLRTLRAFAKESGVTVIVIRHFTKGDPRFGRNPKHAGGGSIGIIGAVRSGLIVAPDPAEDPSAQVKVLARAKNNLVSKAAPTAVRYRLVSATEQIGDIPAQEIVCVEWLGVSHYTAWDLLDSDQERGALGEAVSWLRERLATAPEPKQDVVAAARADARIATRTLERAAAALGRLLEGGEVVVASQKTPAATRPVAVGGRIESGVHSGPGGGENGLAGPYIGRVWRIWRDATARVSLP